MVMESVLGPRMLTGGDKDVCRTPSQETAMPSLLRFSWLQLLTWQLSDSRTSLDSWLDSFQQV